MYVFENVLFTKFKGDDLVSQNFIIYETDGIDLGTYIGTNANANSIIWSIPTISSSSWTHICILLGVNSGYSAAYVNGVWQSETMNGIPASFGTSSQLLTFGVSAC